MPTWAFSRVSFRRRNLASRNGLDPLLYGTLFSSSGILFSPGRCHPGFLRTLLVKARAGLALYPNRIRGGGADHVHLLVGVHPALNISVLINNLKSASSRHYA
ncbi:transposase [Sulfobacillus sp. hq2]|uniref:transposase n=1 Tax=Sulfobacillus TaxID=28033 RepID=UPI003510F7E3